MSKGFYVPVCECGHKVGEHKSGGTRWPYPPLFGICLVPGCDCREFVEQHAVKDEAA